MEQQQLIFAGNGIAYHQGHQAAIRLNGALAASGSGPTGPILSGGATPSAPVDKAATAGLVAPWGPGNDWPQQVLLALAKSTILYPVLDWKNRAVYGSGIVYGKVIGYKPDGSEIFQPIKNPVLREFFRRSNLDRYGFEGLQGLLYFGQAFPELIVSNDRSQITSVTIQDAPFCRYATQQQGQALPPWVYISAGWPAAVPGDGYTEQVPTLDPYYSDIEHLRADKRGFKYIWPLSVSSPGNALYQVPAWSVILKSRWFDVALAVPEFKKQLFDNQLSIKYLIEADVRYWEWKYPDWKEKKDGERKRIIAEELDAFEKTMAGTAGAGKTLLSVTMPDPTDPSKMIKVFTISAIDDKIKSGLYIEDSQEAASHFYTALQVDATLAGVSPGKDIGSGSGSDKRVAFNVFVATHSFYQSLLLEVLNFIRDYNGWDPDLEFRFLVPQVNTADANKETNKKADG